MNNRSDADDFIGLDISIHNNNDDNHDDNGRYASADRQRGRGRPTPGSNTHGDNDKGVTKAAKSSKKRSRSRTATTDQDPPPALKKKPRPPPAPPSSLVKLLQKDKKVLSYFQSLQENLDYDVEKWKREARKWRGLVEKKGGVGSPLDEGGADGDTQHHDAPAINGRAKKKPSNILAEKNGNGETDVHKQKSKKIPSDRRKSPNNNEKIPANNKKLLEKSHNNNNIINDLKKNNDEEGSTISITHDALFGDDGSDFNSSKSSHNNSNNKPIHPENSNKGIDNCFGLSSDGDSSGDNGTNSEEDEESTFFFTSTEKAVPSLTETQHKTLQHERHKHILQQLKKAKNCLDLLGVSLVEVEVKTTTKAMPSTAPTASLLSSSLVAENKDDNYADDNKSEKEVPDPEHDDNQNNLPLTATKTTSTIITVERTLHRQPDEKIAAEMMASLRTLIKASSFIGFSSTNHDENAVNDDHDNENEHDKNDGGKCENDSDEGENNVQQKIEDPTLSHEERMHRARMRRYYHPFCGEGKLHVPTVYYSERPTIEVPNSGRGGDNVSINNANSGDTASTGDFLEGENMPQHPASIGLQTVMQVLSIMDTYCRDDLDDDDWNAIFEQLHDNIANENAGDPHEVNLQEESKQEELLTLQIGMRNRCRLANRISSSLDIEITRIWALTDRTTYLATPSIHFHPADVIDPNEETKTDGEGKNVESQDPLLPGNYGAKSYNRLMTLEERISHARIATLIHRRRGDWQKAAELVVGFIVSSAPSLNAEQYPKLPPVLSLCILEALLVSDNYLPLDSSDENQSPLSKELANGWFYQQILFLFDSLSQSQEESAVQLTKALAYPVHVAGSIWRERSNCSDDRIRDIALLELAAYERLRRTTDGAWLNSLQFESESEEHSKKIGMDILSSAASIVLDATDNTSIMDDATALSQQSLLVAGISCLLLLLTIGDVDQVIKICDKILLAATNGDDKGNGKSKNCISSSLFLLPACCYAYTNIMCRKWDSIKLNNMMGRHTASAHTVQDKFSHILESITEVVDTDDWAKVDSIVQCCVLLGDGRSLLKLANNVLPHAIMAINGNSSVTLHEKSVISRVMTVFVDAGEIPTVRVINLKRRPDRLLDFMSHATKEQLIVIKGPARLRKKTLGRTKDATIDSSSLDENEAGCGYYAFDGQCSVDELEDQLLERLDGHGKLTDFVRAKWRPGDLRAFDKEARSGNELVPTSITERACALSHIASWMGVEQSLSEIEPDIARRYDAAWYQQKLIRTFKISGFARGPSLLHENADMEPVPVCVILEDDAVLSDRFAERLSALLEELPRDFHFCSLGYSRPKTAPMVEFSSQLGIPSCIWYLTGYVISLAGAKHLIRSLPVTGPIDSWIGLKMCSNWDNVYGHWIGVGKHARAQSKLPSRKDLSKILKFRAFAALVPLCAQKVGKSSVDAEARVNWRDRDTDITYSG